MFWGVEDVQGFRAEDRARTCHSHGEVLSWPPAGKGRADPTPCLRALRRGHQTDPWGSAGHGEQAGQDHGDQKGSKGSMLSSLVISRCSKSGKGKGSKTKEGNQHYAAGHHQVPKAAQPKRRGDVHERGRIAVATTWWPFGHDAQGERT